MKKIDNRLSAGKRFSIFMKHYFGYIAIALFCAVLTVVVVGYCAM